MHAYRVVVALSFLALAAFGTGGPAWAGELCIQCSEPAAAYRCTVAGEAPGAPIDPAAQLLCVREIATKGRHKSCTVVRALDGPSCGGILVTVDKGTGPAIGPAAAPAIPATAGGGPANANAAATDVPAPVPAAAAGGGEAEGVDPNAPRTMEELAKNAAAQSKKDWADTSEQVKRTTEQAGQGIKDAGNAVGGAVKKSIDCVATLFSSC